MSSNKFARAASVALLPMLLAAAHVVSAAEPAKGNCPAAKKGLVSKQWTQETYQRYMQNFDKGGDTFGDFYDENIYFHDGPGYKGRKAMVDLYAEMRKSAKETSTPKTIVIDNGQGIIAVELNTRIEVMQDGKMGTRPMKKGTVNSFDGVIFYTLKDGCIADIRGRMVAGDPQGAPGGPPPGGPPPGGAPTSAPPRQ